VKLDFKVSDLQLADPWKLSRTSPARISSVVLVKLTDSSENTGVGEAAPVARYGESTESVITFFKRVDQKQLSFENLQSSNEYLSTISSSDISAKCALNVALMDGAARMNQRSISDFLSLGFSEHKHITSFTLGIDSPDMMQKKALRAQDFPVFKIKVGTIRDKEILNAVREVAPQKAIRVDANEGWPTKEQALETIEWLASVGNIQFVEQPLPTSTPVSDWVWLKNRSPLPLFADESYHSAKDCECVAEGFHGVNVKLVKAGGITSAVDALKAARKAGLKTMLGCMIETSILISAGAHLAELCDFLDLDGNLLITNDPYCGVTAENGVLSFANASEHFGLRVCAKEKLLPPI
jgi:L-alanine-DL-glutamate epimerase-like enolase superfamily enzyme